MRKIIFLTLTVVVLCTSLSAQKAKKVESGQCGDNVYWLLTTDGTLTISGKGAMWDYDYARRKWTPWHNYTNNYIRALKIENGVTKVGFDAFRNCNSMRFIEIPKSLEYVTIGSFEGTAWLNSQPNGIIYIGKTVYGWKGNMPQGVHVDIKNGMRWIAEGAFSKCINLGSISLPQSLVGIEAFAFNGCTGLKLIDIPKNVEKIGKCAFANCDSLNNITLPEMISEIEYGMFGLCKSLFYVEIPYGVKTIGKNAFYGCIAMDSVKIANSVNVISEGAFYKCSSLDSIVIPESVVRIEKDAFKGCATLYAVNINDGVKLIGESAFDGCCLLNSIDVPRTVKEIKRNAFKDCAKLKHIAMRNMKVIIDLSSFDGCIAWESSAIGPRPQPIAIDNNANKKARKKK